MVAAGDDELTKGEEEKSNRGEDAHLMCLDILKEFGSRRRANLRAGSRLIL